MKTLRLLLAMSFLCALFGCQSAPSGAQSPLLIGPLLDRLVPADYKGDGSFAERGQYLTVEIVVKGLERHAEGWTWRELEYRRTLSLPIFAGAAYKHEGWVRLTAPK